MNSIKEILNSCVQKQRFEFEDVLSKPQIKKEIISILDQIQMLLNGGMTIQQIKIVMTNNRLNPQNQEKQFNLQQIKTRIKSFKSKQKNGYIFAKQLIDNIDNFEDKKNLEISS